MPKISKIEYHKRLFAIQSWILEGIPSGLIVRQIISSGWTDAQKELDQKRSAERMLANARNYWVEQEDAAIEVKRKLRIARLERIGNKLNDNYKSTPQGVMAQVAVEKLIIELEGSKAPTKVELTGKGGQPIKTETTLKLTPDEVKEYANILQNQI